MPKITLCLLLCLLPCAMLQAATDALTGALQDVKFEALTHRQLGRLGEKALRIFPAQWKHAETTNFVYHYRQSFVAGPVATEAEAYYRMIAKDLEKDTSQWEHKSHIYIFEEPVEWQAFKDVGGLDPWTGGLHAGHELFIIRNPQRRFKGDTLAHEIAHLVIHRFFGPGVPLWLNEGYAEYAATRFYAAFHRARGYSARPRAGAVDPTLYIPLQTLTSAVSYPNQGHLVTVFYDESQRLVRFLSSANRTGFATFMDAMSKGNRFDTALTKGFGSRFPSLDALEREFKEYATKEHGTALGD